MQTMVILHLLQYTMWQATVLNSSHAYYIHITYYITYILHTALL